MSKEGILLVAGVIIALLPFSGIPHSWLDLAYPVIGIAIAVLAFIMLRARKDAHARTMTAPTYEAP